MRVDSNYINNPNFFDVLIVGAGPAGLTAALYCQRANLKTAFYEKETPGGKVVKTSFVENYPGYEQISGPDLAMGFFKQVSSLGVKFIFGEVTKIKKFDNIFHVFSSDNLTRYAKAVIIAAGMTEKKLNIEGETKYYGKGVSYCAICDSPLYKNKPVAVIGGGNTALEEALYLSDIVSKVYLIHRRQGFRADASVVDKVKNNKKIELFLDFVPIEFIGENNKINAIKIQNVNDKKMYLIKVDCIFPFIGFIPLSNIVSEFDVINKETGFIETNSKMETKIKGLYSIGDINLKSVRQIATAVGDGAIAGVEVKRYIEENFQ
ncbi:MAG: thioredoxin-disulfide reductase [Malacoplasma sp.]|nr:thioredoxin-disulfide reductase [Malacoplasma sp.]